MLIINKYNQTLNLNFKNLLIFDNLQKNNFTNQKNINYIFLYKNKLLRNLIYFYSVFLINSQFSCYYQKTNPNFKVNVKYNNILLLEDNYNVFF